jgi:hypothetical protein
MNRKTTSLVAFLLLSIVLLAACGSGTPEPSTRIQDVERVNSFGMAGSTANARPGHDILLVSLQTDEEINPFGSDLVLVDAAGAEYPMMGLYQMKYIFEVPEDAQELVLVVKGSERVPLP